MLCVVYGHAYHYLGENSGLPFKIYALPMIGGVDTFFVLSGFLIGRILLRTLTQEILHRGLLLEFWIRRWYRTLPNYFLVLSLLLINYYLQVRTLPEHVGLYAIFLQNFASPHPPFFEEAWSLSIEEWFYLLTPLPLYISLKLIKPNYRQSIFIFWIIAVIVTITAFRSYRAANIDQLTLALWDSELRKQVLTRLDSLMYGVLGAYCSLYRSALWTRNTKVFASIGLALIIGDKLLHSFMEINTFYLFYSKYLTFTVSSVAVLLMLPFLSSWKTSQGCLGKFITLISIISYSMYLLNLTPIQGILMPALLKQFIDLGFESFSTPLLQYSLYWLLTMMCSFLLYYGYEKPMTELREKWHLKNTVHLSAD